MKKVGRLLALSASAICALGTMTSCNKTGFKVGLLCLHGQTSTYDKNFIEAFEDVCTNPDYGFNLKEGEGYEIRTDVKEDYNDIYTAAKEWAEDGYSMVFADSFGHQYGLIDVAKEYPNTEFCHATGTTALLNYEEGLQLHNYHNAFANIYKGRYLAGVAAGAKMIEDINDGKYKLEDARIGYVGAWPYAEVISGYTSFYLGACSQFDAKYNPDGTRSFSEYRPTMYVKYTYSWYDYGAEKEAAFELIRKYKCKLISQHADSMGAPQACDAEKIPNVCYNVSTKAKTPNTYLYGSKINWRPYFAYIIGEAQKKYNKEEYNISTDYVGDLKDEAHQEEDMVNTLDFGSIASEELQGKVADARQALIKGEIHVFDCDNFTVTKRFYGKDDPKNRNPFAGIGHYINNPDEEKRAEQPYVIKDYTGEIGADGKSDCEQQHIQTYFANVEDRDDFYAPDTFVNKMKDPTVTDLTQAHYYIDESAYDMNEDPATGMRPTKISEDSFRSAPFFELIIDGIETLN